MISVRAHRLVCVWGCIFAATTTGPVVAQDTSRGECRAAEPAAGVVQAVADGRSFTLGDGREVRLAAIEPPLAGGPAAAARAALAAAVAGNDVSLKRLAPEPDRYGRMLARAFVVRDGAQRSVEVDLVAKGHAFVGLRSGDPPCDTALRAAEGAARAAKLGVWGDPYYESRQADHPAAVLSARGRFAVVEGKVVSVRESGGTIYVNFGRRWSEDFTVTIPKRNERVFTAAGLEPKTLAGRKVRVRGWIEERGGPWIEAKVPQQIEVDGR